MSKMQKVLLLILIATLVLRLFMNFSLDIYNIYTSGGDSSWYLQVGRDLVGGFDYSQIPIPVAPLYLLVVGIPQQFLSLQSTVILVAVIQSILLTISCYIIYLIARKLAQDERVGFVAAIGLTTSLSFITESNKILTEPFYIFFVVLALWLYIDGFLDESNTPLQQWLSLLLAGVVLGLATLTRSLLILFPLGIAIHMLMIGRWKPIVAFLLSYAFITLSWTAYTSLYYEWTVIGSNQFVPAIWRGAVEGDSSPAVNDEIRGDATYSEQTFEIITSDPLSFLTLRFTELSGAYLQPHGTLQFSGESLKAQALQWIDSGFNIEELQNLLLGEGFLPKLLIYIWHYTALIFGIVGMWLTRHQWHISLVLIGFVAYTTLIHLVGLALPRYIYPTYPLFWVFAAVTIVSMWDGVSKGKSRTDTSSALQND